MADFDVAVAKTLANEGGFSINPTTGEVSNHGITVWFLRSVGILSGSGSATAYEIQYVRDLTVPAATNLYRQYFWNEGFYNLDSQQLANKAFDLAVNMGVGSAVKLLQRALNELNADSCEVDGVLGKVTAAACNSADENVLYTAFISQADSMYRQIAKNPSLAPDLQGWLNRLHKD